MVVNILSFIKIVMFFIILIYNCRICIAAVEFADDFIVSLKVNNEIYHEFTYIKIDHKNDVFIPYETLNELGIKDLILVKETVALGKIKYVNLSKLSPINYNFDSQNLILTIYIPPNLMRRQFLDLAEKQAQEATHLTRIEHQQVSNANSGAFINYDLTFSNRRNARSLTGVQDFNYFTGQGVFNHTVFTRLSNKQIKRLGEKNSLIRLDTSYTINNEANLTQLKIGDSITKPADWGAAARFVGIQYASEFSIRPNIITYPLFNYKGLAELPSTLDLYAANQLPLYSGNIKPGEFDLTNIPLPTGKGEVMITARDINGRIQTLVLPYYITPQLLKPGLTDFSYAIGMQRFGYGARKRDKYKYFISNFDYSLGMTENFTNTIHFESQRTASIGNTVYYKLNDLIIINGSVATNIKSKISKGQKFSFGVDYIDKRYFFNSNLSFGGSNFVDTYNHKNLNQGGLYTQTAFGYDHEELGNFSINYLTYPVANKHNHTKLKIFGINYDKKISKDCHFRINGGTNIGKRNKNNYIIFSLHFTLDNKTYAQASYGRQNNESNYNLSISSPVNNNLGWGYYAGFGKAAQSNNYNLRLSNNSAKVNSNIAFYHYGHDSVQQLNLSGALVSIERNLYLTQPIYDSFALVKTGEIQNLPIYNNNQLIVYSNSQGKALVPNLPAYTKSKISLDESQIPLEANILENKLSVIPKRKSGAIVSFNLIQTKSLQMTLIDIKGKPLKYNMDVRIEDLPEELFFTGYNGLVFIQNIGKLSQFVGSACEGINCCRFNARLNPQENELIDLGNIICR